MGSGMPSRSDQGEFAYLVHDVARLLRREFDRRIRALNLTRAQWTALAALIQQDGLTQTELAYMLDMGRAPLGTLVERLERDGWVKRKPDQQDKRVNRVYITRKIRPLLPRLKQISTTVYDDAVAGLAPDAVDEVVATLGRVKANLVGLDGE